MSSQVKIIFHSQILPIWFAMCDDSVTSHFCPRLTHICHRICQPRQPKVAPTNVRASAKWGFCRHGDKGFTDKPRGAGFTTFSPIEEHRAYARISRDWHLIGTIQFLSTAAFRPSDNLVALSQAVTKENRVEQTLDIKCRRSLFVSRKTPTSVHKYPQVSMGSYILFGEVI